MSTEEEDNKAVGAAVTEAAAGPQAGRGAGAGSSASSSSTSSASPPLSDLDLLLSRPTPFPNETGELPNGEFAPGEPAKAALREAKVLVIGAGGLGCELLHTLAYSGFRDIHVIDADTVDVTNLNRQFLFRKSDIGSPKATAAAAFINKRCPWVKVTSHVGYIQDKDEAFYKQFKVVLGGLDNLVARRWINALLCSFVETDPSTGEITNPEDIVPFIDGGTEGFGGQVRLIIPKITSCFECSIDTFPPPTSFQLCTIAETPRKPEHCIAFAMVKQWDEAFPDTKLDKDNPEHMRWLYERALERAAHFGIEGVTYQLTMGVVKSVIPAIASTNALIAASCVLEATKIVSYCSQTLNNFFMYMGKEGVYSYTSEYRKKPDCSACGRSSHSMEVSPHQTLEDFIAGLKEEPKWQFTNPSIRAPGLSLYLAAPAALRAATEGNLKKTLGEMISDGTELTVTDPVFPQSQSLSIVIRLTR